MGSRSGLGTAPLSGGGTGVPGGTSVLALLDVNDRTAFDSLDTIDKTHLLVRVPVATTADDSLPALPAPAREDSPAATCSAVRELRRTPSRETACASGVKVQPARDR